MTALKAAAENLVFSNVLHRPARTFVSILGIAVGVLLIVFTVGLANGTIRKQAQREANVGAEIMFRASGSIGMSGSESFRLPITLARELTNIEGVKAAVAIGQNTVSAPDSKQGSRLVDGVNFDAYAQMAGLQIVEGRGLAPTGDEAIIDTGWQKQLKFKIGDTMKFYERDFTVVGSYEPAAGARVKIPLSTMQAQLGGENRCSAILVSVKEGFTAEQIGEKIHERFPDNQVIFTKDLEELYMSSVPALGIFLNVIIGVATAISALVILLTMYTTVTERTRQIGILKSLGMSNASIAWIIAQEALLISLFGILTGVFLTYLLRFVLTQFITLDIEIKPPVVIVTFLVGLAGGALGALYPALRASRLDAVEALNYE
jgi:putative ABC transport system permease protein